ncbi:phage portal protein [Pseudonocardia hydrocarbonoxydans]|uniref:Histone H1 n=1 Tax=Pseudonocardia hydrocarbonoxydans TaxID=76726 RepID=A0A4Y3WTB3_9PSEU|nr:phage portal protein [Pseudonocardia hydrocarbonoxydans]GEC20989.1 histone H1 [Pseudonocardia hydrocarbonoxydans]
MGLGRLLAGRAPIEQRVITDYAVIDGVRVDGSGVIGTAYRGALGVPGVWRAAMLISDTLGSLPWHAYRDRAGQPVERLAPTPPLLDRPSPPETRVETWSSLFLDLLLQGNAVAVVAARNVEGWPTALIPVPATSVGVRRRPAGLEYRIGDRTFGVGDVLHVKGPCAPGSLRGMAVVEHHLRTIELAHEQGRQASSLTDHGVPTGLLKTTNADATREDLLDIKAGWLRSQRERTVAVLNATSEFVPLSWDPTQTQLLDARKFALHEIALIFNLDPSWLGAAQSSRVYSNITEDTTNLVRFSLGGHLARFEQGLSALLPRGTWAKANVDGLLRATTRDRYQAHEIALRAGWLDVDEVRALEDLPPMTPAQRAARSPAPAPAAPDPTDDEQPDQDGDPS